MITVFIEATDKTLFNWGKFLVGRFTAEEFTRKSSIDPGRILLGAIGWNPDQILVMDLQTCEGAFFLPGGHAGADLVKHRIWVCPMFELFLAWLYKQDLKDLTQLPSVIDLGDVPISMHGYRRKGPPG